MLNLIPAILLLLAGGPFGPPSGDAFARIEALAPRARVFQLAIELERAGLTPAQAVLAMASCQEQPVAKADWHLGATPTWPQASLETSTGFANSSRTRDGPL